VSHHARTAIREAAPLLVAMGVLMIGHGLLGTIVGIRATREGFPTAVIGMVMSCYYLGFLAGCLLTPRMVARRGHVPLFFIFAAVSGLTALAYPLVPHPAAWAVIRATTGFSTAGLYVVAESWLASTGTPTARGRLLAVYLLVVNSGYGAGQLLLGVGEPSGMAVFVLAAVVVALSAMPLWRAHPAVGSRVNRGHLRVADLLRAAPLGMATSLATGVGVGAILGLGAAYGTAAGMPVARVGVLMAAAMAGGIVLQWPIGWLSDRINRRHVIIGASLAAGVWAMAGWRADPLSVWLLVVMFGFTAFSFPLYSLAISHVNDAVTPDLVVPASAAILATYGVGTLVGPMATSLAMQAWGPGGFWVAPAFVHLLLGGYGLYRLVRRRRMLQARHLPPLPVSASPQAAMLIEDTAEMPTLLR
jgi:MFS family permease